MSDDVAAVVFDLWETLIPLPVDRRGEAFAGTCAVLGMTPEAMRPHWDETRRRRETSDLADYLRWLGDRLDMHWSDEVISAAMAARMAVHQTCFADRYPDGEAAIGQLRERGLATALVSNCSSDVRAMLAAASMDGWFDHIVLSAETEQHGRLMKPDIEIYRLATDGLGLDPTTCLYVGDGGDTELGGAAALGMRPFLYDRADTKPPGGYPVIRSHLELLDEVEPTG